MKFKAKVYRDAIERLDQEYFACSSIYDFNHRHRFSKLFVPQDIFVWTFSDIAPGSKESEDRYIETTKLGRRTREFALELAAHLEETGEMDRILKGK